jgi:protein gp37
VLPPEHREWTKPLRWSGAKDPLLGPGQPSLIFVADMGEVFHERRPATQIDQVVGTIAASRHIGQLLTRRPRYMAKYFLAPDVDRRASWRGKFWLGFSAERQKEFDKRWPHMRPLAERGWTVFASLAPLLAPVTLPDDFLRHGKRIWVICSGEQGKHARYMNPDWARAVRDQCVAARVPFFLLQMSGQKPIPHDLYIRKFPKPMPTDGR